MSYFIATLGPVRADRLVAIVLLLQAHGQLTAGQLAELLETSERTVRRDLDALCMAGIPVYSQRGRGGGWALLGGHRLDLTGFTAQDARALFLVAGAQTSRLTGGEPGLKSALRKVLAALPEPLRRQAEAATQATVIDPSAWGGELEPEPACLEALRGAVIARVQVDLDYVKPGGRPARRRVHPYGLVAKRGVWYLLGGTSEGRRTFRLSRIEAMAVTDQPAELPDEFDLVGEWTRAQGEFVAKMGALDVHLEVADRCVLPLTASMRGWVHASHADSVAPLPGWCLISAKVPHLKAAAAHLAPFGADVRVRSPKALEDELARIGWELVAAHGQRHTSLGAKPGTLPATDDATLAQSQNVRR